MLRRTIACRTLSRVLPGNKSLAQHDPDVHDILNDELRRQVAGLELIASENFTSRAVLECLGSVATNKYAEGLPGARYYGGSQHVDALERLCQERALEAFRLDPEQWGVNVQPYSGSPANLAVFTALLQPHDRIMGLDLPCGGHLTHGFYTPTRKVSASSIFFESLSYRTNDEGRVDFADLRRSALRFRPKLIIAGGSAYPRDWDYAEFRSICDAAGARLMVDMSHYSGLVATEEHANPFAFADVVTTTTHKTLRGPRSGMIFSKAELRDRVNNAVFPSLQGGPHMHQIAAVATQLREVMSPEFKEYARAVKRNSYALAEELVSLGHTLVSGGTDNHLCLMDLRPLNITGSKAERLLEAVDISVNKNSVPGDKSAVTPGGLRIGSPALTTRGFEEHDMREVARLLDAGIRRGLELQQDHPKLHGFTTACRHDPALADLRREVVDFSHKFPFPGLEDPFPIRQ